MPSMLRAVVAVVLLCLPTTALAEKTPDAAAFYTALDDLRALEKSMGHLPSDADRQAFMAHRQIVDAVLAKNPTGPLAWSWFDGKVRNPITGDAYGWLQSGPAQFEIIYSQQDPLPMDRAFQFAVAVNMVWAMNAVQMDRCLAQKALALLHADAPTDVAFRKAITVFGEAERLQGWALNSARAKMLRRDKPGGGAEDLATIKSEMILKALDQPEFDPKALTALAYFNAITGVEYTADQKAAALADFDPALLSDIQAAKPFYKRLLGLFGKPYEDAMAVLCR